MCKGSKFRGYIADVAFTWLFGQLRTIVQSAHCFLFSDLIIAVNSQCGIKGGVE